MHKKIPITGGLFALVDERDYVFLRLFNWFSTDRGDGVFRAARKAIGLDENVYMHREIMQAPEGLEVDHENGDTLDNRRGNLRIATHAQNMRNMKRHKDNASGFKGVSWHAAMRQWRSVIWVDNKQRHLGMFNDRVAAAKAYDSAALKFFGQFARLNFPVKGESPSTN
jgi:hypothetical protein